MAYTGSMATTPPYDPGAENMADHLLRMVGGDFGAAIERCKKDASTYRQESSLFRSIGDMAAANEQAQTALLMEHTTHVLINKTKNVGTYLNL